MATVMSALHSRADDLRQLPKVTPHRLLQILKAEFPHADRDMLVRAAKLEGAPRGVTPEWAMHGQPLRPTQIRFQAKKGGPGERRAERAREEGEIAALLLPHPQLPLDDGGRQSLPEARGTELDEFLAAISSGDFFRSDDSEGGTEEGEDGMSDYVYPTMDVEARDVREGDYVEGKGVVSLVSVLKSTICLMFSSLDSTLHALDEKVRIRIEDDGMEN